MTPRALLAGVVALMAGPAGARAQEWPRRLDLHDTLAAAARGNPRIVAASIDLAVAGDRSVEARAARDAVLSVTLSGTAARSDPVAGEIFQRLATDAVTLSGAVKRPLDDGSTVTLGIDQSVTRQTSRLEANGSRTESTDTVFAPVVKLSYLHPFLRSAGADTALAGPRRAAVVRDAAGYEREAVAGDVLREVIEAYWELVAARRALDIRRASVQLAQDQLRVVQVAVAAGTVAADAAVEVEAELALREENLLVAEGALVERSLDLRRLAGLPVGPGELGLEPIEPGATPADPPPSLDEAVARALARNPRLLALRARGAGARIDLDVADASARPQLDLSLTASASGNAPTAEEAFNQLGAYGGLRVDASLTYSAPFGRDGPQATRSAARRQLARARVDVADLESQTTVAVVRAVDKVRLARKRIDTLAKSSELTEINLENERKRWQAGQSRTFDVLRRQNELGEARLRSSRALVDHLEAIAELQALTGDLLTAHGVTLE